MKIARPAPRCVLLSALAIALASSGFSQERDPISRESLPVANDTTTRLNSFSSQRILSTNSRRKLRARTPSMIGDFYSGNPLQLAGDSRLDRLFVYANDLDVPNVLPSSGSILSLSEPGPVGIFSTSLTSIQDIQGILRSGQPLPSATLVGVINENAVLASQLTVSQIQSSLVSTGMAYDIIAIASPTAPYASDVLTAFQNRNGTAGTILFDENGSGAVLQGGADNLVGGEDADAFYFYDYVIRFNATLADGTSGGVGRMKIAEGGSVLPQDRIFFRYNYLNGVRYGNSGSELNRIVAGFERSILDGLFSLELRAPFATDATTASSIDGTAITNGEHTRFGNLTINLKTLLLEREHIALSVGLGIGLPSANDVTVNLADGTPLLRVANESVRLQPFLGSLITPSKNWFLQSFLQLDTAANGNSVFINSQNTGLNRVGRMADSTNLFLDTGLGYWLYRSDSSKGLTGIIPMLELHHNVALQDPEIVAAGPYQVSNDNSATSLTNLVVANTLEFNQSVNLSTAYTTPIAGGASRQYNGGLQVVLSRGW